MRAARRSGLRLLGPDSSGLVVTNPEVGLHAHTGVATPLAGKVGLAIQSGAISSAIFQDSARRGVGLSSLVSLGSAGDITANDLLIYWEGDPFTSVIALYVESVGTPRRFGRLARRIGRTKPVVAIKGGRTAIGSTGNESAAVEALFRSAGVIRAETISEMFDVVKLLSRQPLPKSRRVAVVADEPGPASMLATALEAAGLELPAAVQVGDSHQANPVLVSEEAVSGTIAALVAGDIGAVVAVRVEDALSSPIDVEVDGRDTPVVLVRMGVETDTSESPIPSYPYPEQAARALSSAVRYAEWRARPEGVVPEFPDVDRAGAEGFIKKKVAGIKGERAELDAEAVRELLHRYHIPVLAPQTVARVSLGMREDPTFGPLIRFGMAGEVSRKSGDEAWRINPLTDVDASEMMEEVRSAAVLNERDADRAAIESLILRFSYLVEDHPEIVEMDLEPVAVGAGGSGVAVEAARVVVRPLESRLVASRKDVPGRMA